MRRLIVNADDFGLTPGINRAILECHAAGTVTSATLMANGPAFEHAVELARARSSLGVGCHVVLIDGEPLAPVSEISSIVAAGTKRFRDGLAGFAIDALRGRLDRAHIERECAAQMRKIQSAGLSLTHFDSHKHTHMFPAVLRGLLRAARECGVRAVRNPFVPIKALVVAHALRRPRLWLRYSEVRILRALSARFERAVRDAGLVTTQGTFGVIATGSLDEELLHAILASVPEGTWEFVCHPGYNDADLDRVPTRLRASREMERALLTSPETEALFARHGIERIRFSEL